MKQGLLVIDVQNDYFSNGKLALHQPEIALQRINQLEKHFLERSLPIIYIQHVKYSASATFFKNSTPGVELHPSLMNKSDSIVIEKHFPNSFYQTNLEITLRDLEVQQLVICGMMTHMCIDSTTRASKELQFNPVLIQDATATKNLEINGHSTKAADVQNSFIAALSNFAEISSTKGFLD